MAAPRTALGSPAPSQRSGTVLGFDFGERRTGVAVGELATGQAHALTVIDARDNSTRFARIAALIDEWRPARLVVGLPRSLDGAEHAMSARCRRFANQLHGRYGLPVDFADERLSSWEAEQQLGCAGRGARPGVDATAARIILQDWLDDSARR